MGVKSRVANYLSHVTILDSVFHRSLRMTEFERLIPWYACWWASECGFSFDTCYISNVYHSYAATRDMPTSLDVRWSKIVCDCSLLFCARYRAIITIKQVVKVVDFKLSLFSIKKDKGFQQSNFGYGANDKRLLILVKPVETQSLYRPKNTGIQSNGLKETVVSATFSLSYQFHCFIFVVHFVRIKLSNFFSDFFSLSINLPKLEQNKIIVFTLRTIR